MKKISGVPDRRFQVILQRYNPTRLQQKTIIVAAFSDEQRAQQEVAQRGDQLFSDTGKPLGRYFVSSN